MNTTTKVLVGVALVLGVLGLILPRYSALPSLAGVTRSSLETTGNFIAQGGLHGTTLNVTSTSAFGGAVTLSAETTLSNCGTATYTLGALVGLGNATSSPNVATTTVTVTGAAIGDVALVSFGTSSVPTVFLEANITGADTATVALQNLAPTNVAARTSSGTITVCYFD